MSQDASVSAAARWLSLVGLWGLVGIAGLSIVPFFFAFAMSFDAGAGDLGAWVIRGVFVVGWSLAAATPLLALGFLKSHPRYYPIGAVVVILIWCAIAYFAVRQEARTYPFRHPELQQRLGGS